MSRAATLKSIFCCVDFKDDQNKNPKTYLETRDDEE